MAWDFPLKAPFMEFIIEVRAPAETFRACTKVLTSRSSTENKQATQQFSELGGKILWITSSD